MGFLGLESASKLKLKPCPVHTMPAKLNSNFLQTAMQLQSSMKNPEFMDWESSWLLATNRAPQEWLGMIWWRHLKPESNAVFNSMNLQWLNRGMKMIK
jgi:hypothetical protein